jgi:methylenetetrahydrofolate--tRNA-(uracil-5-)-methyltransferase
MTFKIYYFEGEAWMSETCSDVRICVVGGGLAGCECALTLADFGFAVDLCEMRPVRETAVHTGGALAELVCSNSLKSLKPESAAGMQKAELYMLGSHLLDAAIATRVPAGGALAVDRDLFSNQVERMIDSCSNITVVREEVCDVETLAAGYDYVVLATGPLTSDALSESIMRITGEGTFAFFDASAPIVMADSIDRSIVFSQSRYDDEGDGDYLNAPFDRDTYEAFIDALLDAKRVVARDFETRDLFQACQPIEEIARKGRDAARFGPLKPVGLTDPSTGRRPWAALQLRREDAHATSYNLVGFQTNLTFPEQKRVFRMIPGLQNAEFARYGVMHANTFLDAPRVLAPDGRLIGGRASELPAKVYVAGQLAGTEGYCEAVRLGLHVAISVAANARGFEAPALPAECAFGALMRYATDPATKDYQPMHVNFGIMEPLATPIKNKQKRYSAYASRGANALFGYARALVDAGLALSACQNRLAYVNKLCMDEDSAIQPADALAQTVASAFEIAQGPASEGKA